MLKDKSCKVPQMAYLCVCLHVCTVCVYACVCMCVCVCVCVCACCALLLLVSVVGQCCDVYACKSVCVSVHVCVCTCAHMHANLNLIKQWYKPFSQHVRIHRQKTKHKCVDIIYQSVFIANCSVVKTNPFDSFNSCVKHSPNIIS